MADPLTVLGGVGAAVGSASQFGGFLANLFGREAQWKREDTAVQRRAADLQAAGLSKTLAAGGAAASSAPQQVSGFEGGALTDQAIKKAQIQNTLKEGSILNDNAAIATNQRIESDDREKLRQVNFQEWQRGEIANWNQKWANSMSQIQLSALQKEQLERYRADNEIYASLGIPSSLPAGEAGQAIALGLMGNKFLQRFGK